MTRGRFRDPLDADFEHAASLRKLSENSVKSNFVSLPIADSKMMHRHRVIDDQGGAGRPFLFEEC